jgi:hypothetical protein
MKIKNLPDVPAGEAPDFYYQTLGLLYEDESTFTPIKRINGVKPDFTIAHVSEFKNGFCVIRDDDSVEIIDTTTGKRQQFFFN